MMTPTSINDDVDGGVRREALVRYCGPVERVGQGPLPIGQVEDIRGDGIDRVLRILWRRRARKWGGS